MDRGGMAFNFKTDPIWKHKDVVGLDISERSIKVVQLKKKGKLTKLVGYGMMEVPENYIIEGIISEPEKLANLIKDFFSKDIWGKITAPRINMSLAETRVFTRVLTLPHTEDKNREDAVIWEATQIVPMAMNDLYLDWKLIGPNKEDPKLDDIIFAAAPKSIVNSYMQLVNILGLEIIGIETNLSAIARAMVPPKAQNETILIADIGYQGTSMAIYDQFIRVTGSTLVGGGDFTKKIAETLKISVEEADKIKLKKDDKKALRVREAVDNDITEITKEIDRIIRYYYEKMNKENSISRVLICGGTSNMGGLTDYFTQKLNIKTEIGNPWANISVYPIKTVPKEDAPMYTNAIGLALLGVKDD